MYINNIQKSQQNYLDLIKQYEDLVFSEGINQNTICMMLDNIYCFWLDTKDILKFELETLATDKQCIMLSGAVYLDIADNEHYFFKALGEEHIISDPLLKLENFFRLPAEVFDIGSIELFRRTFKDVMEVLTNYQNIFYILPINIIAIENQNEHMELLQKFFLSFINTMLDDNFHTIDDFYEKYLSYADIEKNMIPFFKLNLIFDNSMNEEISLKEKVESYINNQPIMSSSFKTMSESERFITMLFGLVSQTIDILNIASITNLIPFIRFTPTFHYLTLVMYSFIEEKYFREMIEKTIIFYIFHNSFDKNILIQIDFSEFMLISKKENFLNRIIQDLRTNNINIFEKGINEVSEIIKKNFTQLIIDKQSKVNNETTN